MTTSPTPSELAAIAASLAHGTAIDASTAKSFAGQALLLWQACQEATREPTMTETCLATNAALRAKLPSPKRFPITFEEFNALTFEGKRVEDREALFAEYLDPTSPTTRDAPLIVILTRDTVLTRTKGQ